MIDLLLSLLALCGTVAAVCLLVVLLGVLPFVLTGDAAERQGFSAFRWETACIIGEVGMLLLTFFVLKHHYSKLLLAPAVLLPWIGLTAVSLLSPEERLVGGVPGAHEG